MNKIKIQKGITLIALVITIIVLLVLAVTAIGAVKEGGIIGHSQRTATEYELGKEEQSVKLGIMEAKMALVGKTLTGEALTGGLRSQKIEPDRELSETAPFIFKVKGGTGKEYVIMEDGAIETIKTDAKDWIYTVTGTEARIKGCNLTDLNNVIIPKYLMQEDGTVLTVTCLGDGKNKIADFGGALILPDDVTVERYAFNNCLNIEKIVFGENNLTVDYNSGAYQFSSDNIKLKEVKIGKGSQIVYLTFIRCPNIENVIIEDGCLIKLAGFYKCKINNIKIGNNVTVEGRAFWGDNKEIEKILIGDNFVSKGCWLEGSTVKDIIIGKNASLADNGLMAQSNVTINGTVTINGIIKSLGNFSLNSCTIKAPNGCLEIAEGGNLGYQSLSHVKEIKKIKIGKNVIMNNICISGIENDITLECNGSITIFNEFLYGNIILPEKLELSGESVINQPFYYLTAGYNSTLKEVILSPGAKITNFGKNFPNNIKITLKNISEWDSEILASNKTVIEAFGLTKYEEIDGNGVYTK